MDETIRPADKLHWENASKFGVSTYHARGGGWKFTLDKPYSNTWVLRGWPDGSVTTGLYREYKSMKAGREAAHRVAVLGVDKSGV